MKETKLRIWRVVPTNQIGVQAPYFFVETQSLTQEKARIEANKLAKQLTGLSRFPNWNFAIDKVYRRRDKFGRYWKYHQ